MTVSLKPGRQSAMAWTETELAKCDNGLFRAEPGRRSLVL